MDRVFVPSGISLVGHAAVYYAEREAEVCTLTDPRIRQTADELGIWLASYAEHKVV